jgi:hypothetical protein
VAAQSISATITCPGLNQEGGALDTRAIVSELKKERDRLDKAITALDGDATQPPVISRIDSDSVAPRARKRHHLTAAGRKRLSLLMKKRWAERRKKSLSGQK